MKFLSIFLLRSDELCRARCDFVITSGLGWDEDVVIPRPRWARLACDWSVSQREGSNRSSSAVPPPVQLIGHPPRSPSGLEAAEPHMNEAMAASSHRIMLGPLVAAIDQGTSSTRFLVRRTRRRKPSSRPAASYLAVMLSLPMSAVPLAFQLHHKALLLKRWVS